MPQHIQERLPITVYAERGTQVSATQLLNQAFGDGWTHWENFWFRSYSAETLNSWNFGYWDPSQPTPASWSNAGVLVAPYGVSPDLYLHGDNLGQLTLNVGNSITDSAVFVVETTAPGAIDRSFTWYHIKIVDDQLQPLNRSAPTAADVVNSAIHMDAVYRGVPNAFDCGWITDAVGAATGAVLPAMDQSIIPTENREGGFWRIAHRGTDNPVEDWQLLVQPGDIVRFDWTDPAQPQHTTLITRGQDALGNIQVFDNLLRGGSVSTIGLHEANWDDHSNPRSVTIYRLTSDNLYLLEGGANSEILSGTHWNDLIRGNGGGDHVFSQGGDDQIYVQGSVGTVIDGGAGLDTVYMNVSRTSYNISQVSAGAWDVRSSTASHHLADVEKLVFSDGTYTLTPTGAIFLDPIAEAFSASPITARGLASAYEILLGGVPSQAGFKALINGALSSNFGAGPGITFNDENVFINLVNNLVQGNSTASAIFSALAPGATLREKIGAIYDAIIPDAYQTDAGRAFLTRPEGIAFYQQVAAERGVAGADGAAIIALASLLKIAVSQDIGIGDAINDLASAVLANSHNLPLSSTTFVPIEIADGTGFDGDDALAGALVASSAPLIASYPIVFETSILGAELQNHHWL